MGLIRNHYIGRTFIEPSQAIRNFGVKLKLNPVRGLIEGQRVILVDDSIVRGTTSRKIVRMVREAGAKEVHVRISCPPTISPCYYGVDTPTKEELIASSNTPEEIRKYLGADSLGYLSLRGLRQAVDDTAGGFCTSCYTGVYPTDWVQLEVRENGAVAKTKEEVTEIPCGIIHGLPQAPQRQVAQRIGPQVLANLLGCIRGSNQFFLRWRVHTVV